ncbi:tape measure protein [Bosea rubneri]|uniref:Tape measure protein n=1 Tax=Bosea rubneri TaxID=3075434 RepID=A0ABU3SFX6_9HYPH|nr:tape measure protein [Bosea sp. ZW T0_25]MDU0343705.1 tape measure protein [Bosea sp. ZW T0_25]
MAVDVERLQLLLEVQANQFSNALKRQNSQAFRLFKQLEDRASQMEKSVGGSLSALGKRIAGVFAGVAVGSALNDIRRFADSYTTIINQLKVAGVKDGDLGGVFDKLYASAQRNAVPLQSLAELFGRVSQAQTTLKASSDEIMQVTDVVAQSLRVSGKGASEASGALLQLSQAFAGGKVQAEEWGSLLDGAYPLLQAAAAGMKEAGGDVAKLTQMVKAGEVSSQALFRAIQAGAPLLEDKLAGATLTSAQAMEKLKNELTKAAGEFDNATGFSKGLAVAIDGLAGSVGSVGSAAAGAVNGVQALIDKVGELARANAGAQRAQALTYQDERAARVAQAREMGTANAGGRDAVASERSAAERAAVDAARKAVAGFRGSEIDYANRLTTTTLPPARPGGAGKINPISAADFKVPGSKDGKGGGGSSKDTLDSYEKALVASEKRRQALLLEAETEGKGTFAKAKAREALELETAAKRAAIPITEEMRAAIDRAATGYANAKVKVEEVRKALEDAQEAQKFFGDAITDSLGDLVVDGEKATDVMKGLVKQLARAALQAAFMGSGPLAGFFGTSGSNGSPGGLIGTIQMGFKQ